MPPPLAPPGESHRFFVSPRTFERVALLTLLALVFIIVTGAGVRLTNSGLGCTDWPACESSRFVAPLEFHPMVEFVNRLITGLVSIAVIGAVLSALWRLPRRRDLTWLAIGLVLGVFSNAVLGGIVVKVGLAPIFVTLHYLLSIILVWNAYVLYHRAGQPDGDGKPALSPRWDHAGAVPRAVMSAGIYLYGRAGRPATDAKLVVSERLCTIGRVLCALVTVVLITGTLVTGAGPHAGDSSAPRYFFAITEVVRIHGFSVWCFLGTSTYALWIARRQGVPKQVDTRAQWLVGAILAQGALGYAQYFSEVPAAMVIFHLLGSVLVFLATLSFYESLFARPSLDPPENQIGAPIASGSFAPAPDARTFVDGAKRCSQPHDSSTVTP